MKEAEREIQDSNLEEEKEIEEVLFLTAYILERLRDKGINENMVQATLGTAYLRVVAGMGTSPSDFDSIAEGQKEVYRKVWEKKGKYKNAEF